MNILIDFVTVLISICILACTILLVDLTVEVATGYKILHYNYTGK